LNYRHSVVVDVDDSFKQGIGALLSQGGPDRTHLQYIAPNILSFLEDHLLKLQEGYYYTGRHQIEGFPRFPSRDNGGSTTCTNGIKIEAASYYVHHFSMVSEKYFQDKTKYFFPYQIRMSYDQ